jgi:hypothetical protein
MAKRPSKREFALVSLPEKKLVLRGGKPITILAKQPPRGDSHPAKYRSRGWTFEAVETEFCATHIGEPRYELKDSQKAIVTKIVKAN